MSGNAQSGNAQYTESAAVAPDLTEKLSAVRGFISKRKAVMLTTHAPNGDLHSRCMAIGEITPDWKFRFLYDRDSYWDKEIENDSHVNICENGMDANDGWLSIAGKAKRVTDLDMVKHLFNPSITAWFGDKGDGVHTGKPEDPRMAVVEVKVDEIRHFHQKKTSIGTAIDVVASAISGSTAQPGEIRVISAREIEGAWDKGELKEP